MNNKLALLINNNYNNNYIKMIVLGHNSFRYNPVHYSIGVEVIHAGQNNQE